MITGQSEVRRTLLRDRDRVIVISSMALLVAPAGDSQEDGLKIAKKKVKKKEPALIYALARSPK